MYEKDSHWAKHIDFILMDLLCQQIALLLSDMIRFGPGHPFHYENYPRLVIVVALVDICLVFFMEPYSGILRRDYVAELRQVIVLDTAVLLGVILYLFAARISSTYSRMVIFFFWPFSILLEYFVHIFWKRQVRKHTTNSRASRMLLVTAASNARQCQERMGRNLFGAENLMGVILLDDSEIGHYFPGMVLSQVQPDEGDVPDETSPTESEREQPQAADDNGHAAAQSSGKADTLDRKRTDAQKEAGKVKASALGQVPVVGTEEDLIEFCRRNIVDDVLFYNCPVQTNRYSETLYNMGIRVHVNLVNMEDNYLKYQVNTINGIMVLSTSIIQSTTWQRAMKRLMDIIGGIVGCLITCIIAIFVAPVIKIQAPGPVFFSQTRVGRNGRPFKIYKFRSMYVDAEERKKELMEQNKMQGLMFKMDNDPRIYPFGHFLRRTSLDEFPQFFNVLKGNMSLVGTRPPTLDEYTQYEPEHKSRLAMKPGITGLWQVSGRSNITDFEEVVRLDNEYIRNWSLSLDIKILLKTIVVVLRRSGSE